MTDQPLLSPGPRFEPRARSPRPASGSPIRQLATDDLLVHLTPQSALEAFRNPSGDLKNCMDAVSPMEQSFALKSAVAAKAIEEWLDELIAWLWPEGGGSAGFQTPLAERSKSQGSEDELRFATGTYTGSLLATQIAKYEKRIKDINHSIDELDFDEIKKHVLHKHILPMPRPATTIFPVDMVSETKLTISTSSHVYLDELTALITAIIVQALPNLSKLMKLLDVWSVRLAVLRRIPTFLASLSDAHMSLQFGWKALDQDRKSKDNMGHFSKASNDAIPASSLTRDVFGALKKIVASKIAKAGQDLDWMLDMLEGRPDTLPDDWIDQMDDLERNYGDWVASCTVVMRKREWQAIFAREIPPTSSQQLSLNSRVKDPAAHVTPFFKDNDARSSDSDYSDNGIGDQRGPGRFDGKEENSGLGEPWEPSVMGEDYTEYDSEPDSPLHEATSEPELPELSSLRQKRNVSPTFTVAHSMNMFEFSSEPDHGTPERHGRRALASDTDSRLVGSPLNSSPPADRRSSTRSQATSGPEGELTPPMTPHVDSSSLEDESSIEGSDSSARPVARILNDHVQQQISKVLQSLPAKIRLTSEPQPINLNPPDFKMPTAKKPSNIRRDATPRSYSSMSTTSRGQTPAFLLAPVHVRRSRARYMRDHPEMAYYHLSRNGERPMKLLIRGVGEHGERVMVRVGGGWADLGEFLKNYASHHIRHSNGESKVEVKDLLFPGRRMDDRAGSSSPSRRDSVTGSPFTPLDVAKGRRPAYEEGSKGSSRPSRISLASSITMSALCAGQTPLSVPMLTPSRSNSRLNWTEDDSSLGMAGPRAKNVEMSETSRAWVEDVRNQVRAVSGGRRNLDAGDGRFGELGKVGGTKRLYKRQL